MAVAAITLMMTTESVLAQTTDLSRVLHGERT